MSRFQGIQIHVHAKPAGSKSPDLPPFPLSMRVLQFPLDLVNNFLGPFLSGSPRHDPKDIQACKRGEPEGCGKDLNHKETAGFFEGESGNRRSRESAHREGGIQQSHLLRKRIDTKDGGQDRGDHAEEGTGGDPVDHRKNEKQAYCALSAGDPEGEDRDDADEFGDEEDVLGACSVLFRREVRNASY